ELVRGCRARSVHRTSSARQYEFAGGGRGVPAPPRPLVPRTTGRRRTGGPTAPGRLPGSAEEDPQVAHDVVGDLEGGEVAAAGETPTSARCGRCRARRGCGWSGSRP